MCRFLALVVQSGAWFTVENPHASYLWHLPAVRRLVDQVGAFPVVMDQCMFGLGSPPRVLPKEIWRKRTLFLASDPAFKRLARACCKNHSHTPIVGSLKVLGRSQLRSSVAAAYPAKLCAEYAQAALIAKGDWAASA